jgi:hypothetical protein
VNQSVIYSVFGLFLDSNLPIPGLTQTERLVSRASVVRLHLGVSAEQPSENPRRPEGLVYTSCCLVESGQPAFRLWRLAQGALFRLSYSNGMQFWFDRPSENLWAVWPETSSLEDATTYLLGPVLGILLRLRGTICLHASAVAFGEGAVAFVGPSGAGKSTTAAILAQRGCSVLSDDIVALVEEGGTFHVLPAYPFLCLRPNSVRVLYGSADFLPCFVPSWEKRCLAAGNGNFRFETRSLPLVAVYVLGDPSVGRGPFIESVSARSSLITLLANSYATGIISRAMRAAEFGFLGRLASSVVVRSLHAPRNTARFGDFLQAVCQDARVPTPDSASAPIG